MFTSLRQQILAFNTDVNNVATSETAKKLRKKLLSIGIPMAVLGFGSVFLCFILFTVFSIQSVQEMSGFSAKIIIPFVCIIPCALVGGIGASLVNLALQIVLAGYTTTLVQENAGLSCPNCKQAVAPNAKFCGVCGAAIEKVCQNCQSANPMQNEFCSQCGKKLQ